MGLWEESCPHCGKRFKFRGSMAKYHNPCPKTGEAVQCFDKSARDAEFEAIAREAEAAGTAAVEACVPNPMLVVERENPLNDNSAIVRRYAPVMGGVCGFAEVIIKPATTAAARFFAKRYERRQLGPSGHVGGLSSRHNYGGGLSLWVGAFGQSMERKEAFATAFAMVLRAHGIRAYATSRMD